MLVCITLLMNNLGLKSQLENLKLNYFKMKLNGKHVY